MNFLAHLHLAPDEPGMQQGAVLADLVKGPDCKLLPPDVQAGIALHRRIDAATDRHPATCRSIQRISREWGWFSGIVIDIAYDYILANNWHTYSTEPLRNFADRMYAVLAASHDMIPEDARQFLAGLIRTDRLVAYGTVAGLEETLERTANRIRRRMPTRALPLGEAVPQLLCLGPELTADFHELYRELVRLGREQQ